MNCSFILVYATIFALNQRENVNATKITFRELFDKYFIEFVELFNSFFVLCNNFLINRP